MNHFDFRRQEQFTTGTMDSGGDMFVVYDTDKAHFGNHLDHEFDLYGQPRRSASIPMLLLVSSPRLPIQMAWAAQWAAMGPYLGTMLPPWAVQLTQVIGPLTGILVAPTIGVLSDRSVHPWGRRRPYLFYAAFASAICWFLMGYTREMGDLLGDYGNGKPGTKTHRPWTAALTIFFYTWMDITVNIVQVPAYLLIADFAGDRQTTGAALGQSWSQLGAIVISVYIYVFGPAHNTLKMFLAMLSITMVVLVVIVCFFADEVPLEMEYKDSAPALRRIGQAFYVIYEGIVTLPRQLVVYALLLFLTLYGFTAYNGNKGQFFGLEVYGGSAEGADVCEKTNSCTNEQLAYNKGVKLAGGPIDLGFNILSYIYMLILPLLVRKFGAKALLTVAMIPQALLMIVAFSKDVTLDAVICILTFLSSSTLFALLVPIIIHILGPSADIGMYVGALNSANCFGQLANFFIGAAIINTSMGYSLPVFVGGVLSGLAVIVSLFLRLDMYSI